MALSSGNERKGEKDGSDRRNEFHSRRGVDDFEVSSGVHPAVVQSSSLYLWRLCFNLLVSMKSKQASAINRIRVFEIDDKKDVFHAASSMTVFMGKYS